MGFNFVVKNKCVFSLSRRKRVSPPKPGFLQSHFLGFRENSKIVWFVFGGKNEGKLNMFSNPQKEFVGFESFLIFEFQMMVVK